MPRAGGKGWLASELVARIPAHTVWVEPFCGALGAFLAREEPSAFEVVNDTDGALINLLRQTQRHPQELTRLLKWFPHSREVWGVARSAQERPACLTELEWAAETWRRMAWSFGGNGRSFGRVLRGGFKGTGSDYIGRVEVLAERLEKVTIEQLDWRECVRVVDGPGVFIFCDPPYTECEDPGYGVWGDAEMGELAAVLKAAKGDWMVTANDAPGVRGAFAGCRLEEVSRLTGMNNDRATLASVAGGKARADNRRELIIRRG